MYYIKEDVDLKSLEKYGFKLGVEIPGHDDFICNDFYLGDYWLVPMDPDEPSEVHYADEDLPIWSIHINDNRRVWIDCVPSSTYHIDNMDMEQMFYVLKCMIEDGIITDDYESDV